ncbi:uncharacterized protein LOC141600799 [Silene latifolia]|uniref:uncharacterized protein LOC141600799 n=1 Tax=Silene latifolia TaxID=37657 RepID=UPI003D771CD1
MDFIVGLPRTQHGNNIIWVIVDRLTKSTHFIPMKDTWSKFQLANGYRMHVVRLHGLSKDIVSDRDARSLVCWDDNVEAVVLGPQMVQDMIEQLHLIRQKMKAAQDRQKSYAYLHRRDIEFEVGDKVLLKVSPMHGVMRFGKREKLSQKFVGPYEILDRIGEVAYRIALPPALDRVYNVFHTY